LARGSSDHAAHYAAYLVMSRMGRFVSSLPMSLITLHRAQLSCVGTLSLAFSQSGQSPDLVDATRFFRRGGACTLAWVNDVSSPLGDVAEWVFPLHAGLESSVAATKSYIAQLVAGARLVAAWSQDKRLNHGLHRLPAALQAALHADWSPAIEPLSSAQRLLVISRGTGLSIALEAALKLKEVCGIQAEAFSGAELQHGPLALIESDYPVLVFAPRGAAQESLLSLASNLRVRGARVLLAAPPEVSGVDLPLVETGCEDLDPISAVQSFYPLVEALARARGLNPDQPRHLSKVTLTK
jgi:glucosamine--fructose-6-phosphate aminotransferase (isomerizing)